MSKNAFIMDNQIDPFKIFNINYQYDFSEIDTMYYKLSKSLTDTAELNAAYVFLKDPVKTLEFLCNYYGYSQYDQDLLNEIFLGCNILPEILLEESIKHAKLNNWKESWRFLKKYQSKLKQLNFVSVRK